LGGTGGCGAPPSEYNLRPCCVIDEIIVEQPRSEALTNRIEHEHLRKVIYVSPYVWNLALGPISECY
jgi:hypothetical protein